MSILFDYSNSFIKEQEITNLYPQLLSIHDILNNRKGIGNEYTGWLDYPNSINNTLLEQLKKAALKIQDDSDILIVIGIGGSYLGSKSVISSLTHTFYNELDNKSRQYPKIYFAGQNISSTYLKHLIDITKDKELSINVISKSGTTTEPAIAFRFFKEIVEKKYGKEKAAERIYVTTDANKGALKKMAIEQGYTSFVIPDNVGGRYSVHTPVGLLPIAVSGINIDEFILGAKDGCKEYASKDISKNPCYQYAAVRNILYNKAKDIEILVNYEPSLSYLSEWWKQLFGESDGKDGKGIFPASVNFSTDLHSLGQIIQEGKRNIFETIINVENMDIDLTIPYDEDDLDGLNYLKGKGMNYVNKQALLGTLYAHIDGNVPNLIINLPNISAYSVGKLIYFFEMSCALSGYLLGVNPFNQPGVESYKKNMFGLLGKSGFEEISKDLVNRSK